MPDYLVTITAQQKRDKIHLSEIKEIIWWLESNGVVFLITRYEDHGKYKQLHSHCMVRHKGRYAHLTKWGDLKLTYNTFQVHWKKIRPKTYKKVIDYLLKQNSRIVLLRYRLTRERSDRAVRRQAGEAETGKTVSRECGWPVTSAARSFTKASLLLKNII